MTEPASNLIADRTGEVMKTALATAESHLRAQVAEVVDPRDGTKAQFVIAGDRAAPVNPQKFTTDPQSGLPYGIGRTRMSGVRIYADTYDGFKDQAEDDILSFGVMLSAGGQIDAIEEFKADGDKVEFASNGNAIGFFDDWMGQKVWLGGAMASALALSFGGSTPPGWTSEHKLSGITHAMWSLRFDKEGKRYGAGVPEPEWIGRWVRVYDPRKDSTYPGGSGPHRALNESTYEWSRNPALHALTWCLGRWQNGKRTLGIGAPLANIRVADFVEAANVADANGWHCGGFEWSTDTKWGPLKRMLQAGGAVPTMTGAMIGCRVLAPRISVATIRSADLLDELSIAASKSRRDRINTVIPRYRSEAHEWEIISAAPIAVPEYVAEDGGPRRKEIDYPLVQAEVGQTGVNGEKQAGQLAAYDIVNSREAGPINFTTGPKFIGLKTGDCVTLHVPEEGLNNQTVILTSVSLDPSTGKISFAAETETTAKHAFALGKTSIPPPPFSLTAYALVPPAPRESDWTILPVLNADGVPIILVAGGVDTPRWDEVLVQFRKASGSDWTHAGAYMDDGDTRILIPGVDGAADYVVRLAYQNTAGVGDWTEFPAISMPDAEVYYSDGTPIDDLRPAEPGATEGAVIPSDGTPGNVKDEEGNLWNPGELLNNALTFSPGGVLSYNPARDLPSVEIGRVSLPDMGAASVTAVSQAQTALDKLAAAVVRLGTEASTTREIMRDAGISVDPETGVVRIYAIDAAEERLNEVSIRLDAQDAKILLMASTAYVDNAIATAVLDPSQVPVFAGIDARLTTVEIELDALAGEISLKADTVVIDALGARVTTAEENINSLTGIVSTKADTTTFDALNTRVSTAESALSALGDTAGITDVVRVARLNTAKQDQDAETTLSALLTGDRAQRESVVAVAEARRELRTDISDGLAAEAAARTALGVRMGAAEAALVTESRTRATEDSALATQITNLTASLANETTNRNAAVTAEAQARTTADGALAVRLDTIEASYTTDADISAAVSSEAAARASADTALGGRIDTVQASIATETTNRNAAISSEAAARVNGDSALGGRIDTVQANLATETTNRNAAVTAEAQARVNGDNALAGSINNVSTTVDGHTASINSFSESINGLRARAGVRLDVNGRVTGWVLNNNGDSGDMDIVADRFRIWGTGLSSAQAPFEVDASAGLVRIKNVAIGNAAIDRAKIKDLEVVTDKLAYSAASKGYLLTGAGEINFASQGVLYSILSLNIQKDDPDSVLEILAQFEMFGSDAVNVDVVCNVSGNMKQVRWHMDANGNTNLPSSYSFFYEGLPAGSHGVTVYGRRFDQNSSKVVGERQMRIREFKR